jgi:hypothetical protein
MMELAKATMIDDPVEPPTRPEDQPDAPGPGTPPLAAITPMQMLQIAVERGADISVLEKLMVLQERWEANEARKAFVAALSAFKADPPTIIKNKHVASRREGTDYYHATLDQVAGAIGAALSTHGLSHRWEVEQDDGRMVRVTCVLQHVLGHCERVTLQAGPDQSGNKNPIQAVGSTVTYLERYTLLASTGLAAKDQDDDAETGCAGAMISAQETQRLADMLRETGSDERRFLAYFNIAGLGDLPLARFAEAVMLLEQRRRTGYKGSAADPAAVHGESAPGGPPEQPQLPAFVPMKPPPNAATDKAWRTFGARLVAQHGAIAKPQRGAWHVAQAPAFDAIKARSAQLHRWVMGQIAPPAGGDAA